MENKANNILHVKRLTKPSICCPDSQIKKLRVVFNSDKTSPSNVLRGIGANKQEIISFKALIKRGTNERNYNVKRVGTVGSSSPVLQAVQAAGSYLTPGDISKLRSPIRSTVYGALTPGKPRIPGLGKLRRITNIGDGQSRCPEGYQYGGRFTDNKFSTCGKKLFALPGILGATIAAIRKLDRFLNKPVTTSGQRLGAGQYPDSIVDSRAPQIPKVSFANPKKMKLEVQKLITPLGVSKLSAVRMVRRDGFILEPVVSPAVLRTIPDNRDMEGATYLANYFEPNQIGGEELGLLSNTGIQSLKYVLPGGSYLTLEKKRQLTVGERRKLGRTVNSAAEISVEKDPAARLKFVATETGDGIGYSENFVGIKNPNKILENGKQRWAQVAFSKNRKMTAAEEAEKPTENLNASGKNISSVDAAIAHLNSNGSLAEISPSILQEVLARMSEIKIQKINKNQSLVTLPNTSKYILKSSKSEFEHLAEKYASSIQEHFGLLAPDTFFVGEGSKRKYLSQALDNILPDYRPDRDSDVTGADMRDISALMIADLLSDKPNRDVDSLSLLVGNDDKKRLVATNNSNSGLTDLSKIQIRERTEASLDDIKGQIISNFYLNYYQELKEAQRRQAKLFIDKLVQRARLFNFSTFKSKLYSDGQLSSAEKTHLNILELLFKQRVQMLQTVTENIESILSGKQ